MTRKDSVESSEKSKGRSVSKEIKSKEIKKTKANQVEGSVSDNEGSPSLSEPSSPTGSKGKVFAELLLNASGGAKAVVREWKAKALIDIRKYFNDKPTKKGISLSPELFRKFISSPVTDMVALVRKEPRLLVFEATSSSLPEGVTIESEGKDHTMIYWLSENHKVKIYKFKAFTLIDVRFLFSKDKPSGKGISLQLDQYAKLVSWKGWEAGVDKLNE